MVAYIAGTFCVPFLWVAADFEMPNVAPLVSFKGLFTAKGYVTIFINRSDSLPYQYEKIYDFFISHYDWDKK